MARQSHAVVPVTYESLQGRHGGALCQYGQPLVNNVSLCGQACKMCVVLANNRDLLTLLILCCRDGSAYNSMLQVIRHRPGCPSMPALLHHSESLALSPKDLHQSHHHLQQPQSYQHLHCTKAARKRMFPGLSIKHSARATHEVQH